MREPPAGNFVASKAYYDISFRTVTAGAINTITMDFPAGTAVGSALLVEATGIGPGTISASAGEVLTYTVTNAVNVPALTNIRIQISNINNPPTPIASFTVSITTRDAANTPIGGPTPTLAYNMVQVGNAQIAPGAVTTTKIANGAVTSGDIADGAIVPDTVLVFADVLTSVPPQMVRGSSAHCPPTHPHATGGGTITQVGSEAFLILSDSFGADGAWSVNMFNTHPSTAFNFQATATCMADML